MRKFDIGDKVKVIGNCNCHGYEIGEEYTIKCYDPYFKGPNENGYAYNLDAIVLGYKSVILNPSFIVALI